MNHRDAEIEFRARLLSNGYPRESIVAEYPIRSEKSGRLIRPDFLIVDPHNTEHLALFEIVTTAQFNNQHKIKSLFEYQEAFSGIPAYAVRAPDSAGGDLSIHSLNEDGTLDEADTPLLSFDALANARLARSKQERASRRDAAFLNLDRICWTIFILGVVLVLTDILLDRWLGMGSALTAERVAVLGVATAVVLIPFAGRVKAFGFEIETHRRVGTDQQQELPE